MQYYCLAFEKSIKHLKSIIIENFLKPRYISDDPTTSGRPRISQTLYKVNLGFKVRYIPNYSSHHPYFSSVTCTKFSKQILLMYTLSYPDYNQATTFCQNQGSINEINVWTCLAQKICGILIKKIQLYSYRVVYLSMSQLTNSSLLQVITVP